MTWQECFETISRDGLAGSKGLVISDRWQTGLKKAAAGTPFIVWYLMSDRKVGNDTACQGCPEVWRREIRLNLYQCLPETQPMNKPGIADRPDCTIDKIVDQIRLKTILLKKETCDLVFEDGDGNPIPYPDCLPDSSEAGRFLGLDFRGYDLPINWSSEEGGMWVATIRLIERYEKTLWENHG